MEHWWRGNEKEVAVMEEKSKKFEWKGELDCNGEEKSL